MREVTLTLRVLTPLFLSGADQTTAELRAPSFRGLMRYWYRALTGGLIGATPQNCEQIKQIETDLFGATDSGSAITIRVSTTSSKIQEFSEPISVRVGGNWQATGKGYLLWTMARSGKAERGNLKPARWYFPPGTSFHVTLSTRGTDTTKLEQALSAFWLLTQFGGIGSRSRRCAGSLAVQQVQGENTTTLPFVVGVGDAQQLKQMLEQGLKEAKQIAKNALKESEKLQPITQADFDILAPGVCRIWILQDAQPWPSAEVAMTWLGEELQTHRSHIALEQRKIFGLPLPPLFFKERRASPLLLRVVELQEKRYVGLAVLFKTSARGIRLADYQIIENWINTFRGKQEVML